MSSPILPVQSPEGSPTIALAAADAGAGVDAFIAEVTAKADTHAFELHHGTPPPEVLEQIAHAEAVAEQLNDSGRTVRFRFTPGEHARAELCELDGSVLCALSLGETFELAATGTLD